MTDRFEQLRQRFRRRVEAESSLLEAALVAGHYEIVEDFAHRLVGGGATFGFPDISLLAVPVEQAAQGRVALSELLRLASPLLDELRRTAHAV